MALAKKDEIAEAIKDSLNASSGPLIEWAPCVRRHAFEITLEDVARADTAEAVMPVVTVFPRAERKLRTSRISYQHEFDIGVCLQCYCPFDDRDSLDELSLLVEELTDHIGTAGPMASAPFVRMEMVTLFDISKLHEQQQFFALPVFTYRIER